MQDLREWVEHHVGLGVSKVYLLDSNSSRPVGRSIADYIAGGVVDFYYRCRTVDVSWPCPCVHIFAEH